jgi:hypothetical protein
MVFVAAADVSMTMLLTSAPYTFVLLCGADQFLLREWSGREKVPDPISLNLK